MINKSALITGASGGLGADLARQLAGRGYDVVLVARSVEPMESLADEIRRNHGVTATLLPTDLSIAGSAKVLAERLAAEGIEPDLLVNNAGFGLSEPFLDHDPERLRMMLQLNIVSLTELTHFIGRDMRRRGRGHILLVASVAGYMPDPLLAAYGASKAYVLSLGVALNVELAPQVGVTVLSPGYMETGFSAASGFKASPSLRRGALKSDDVAKIGLDALFAGRSSIMAGRVNAFGALATRLISRHALARQVFRISGGGQK